MQRVRANTDEEENVAGAAALNVSEPEQEGAAAAATSINATTEEASNKETAEQAAPEPLVADSEKPTNLADCCSHKKQQQEEEEEEEEVEEQQPSPQTDENNLEPQPTGSDGKKLPANDTTLENILMSHGIRRPTTVAHLSMQQPLQQRPMELPQKLADEQQRIVASRFFSELLAESGIVAAAKRVPVPQRPPALVFRGDAGTETGAAEALDGSDDGASPSASNRSLSTLVCRICHNADNPETLVSPCLCKGTLSYVHTTCLERWISTSRSTMCELCQFQYNTRQSLRYTCYQALRLWYSRPISRRALQDDCQMFSLLTLVAIAIAGTLLVGIQYYFMQSNASALTRLWTKGWLLFFLFTTLAVYLVNIYMIVRSQLKPWYRWWQSARDIQLILENRRPFLLRHHPRLVTAPFAQRYPPPNVPATPLPSSAMDLTQEHVAAQVKAATAAYNAMGAAEANDPGSAAASALQHDAAGPAASMGSSSGGGGGSKRGKANVAPEMTEPVALGVATN